MEGNTKLLADLAKIAAHLDGVLHGSSGELLDESYFCDQAKDIVRKLNKLTTDLSELAEFSGSIARGDIGIESPPRSNFIAGPLKELHSRLMHLTWQAGQIAKGDFSQSLDFMGVFSDAFNEMISKIAERERSLRMSIQKAEEMHFEAASRLKLLGDIIDDMPGAVVIMRRGEVLYENRAATGINSRALAAGAPSGNVLAEQLADRSGDTTFLYHDEWTGELFNILTKKIMWSDELPAVMYIFTALTNNC